MNMILLSHVAECLMIWSLVGLPRYRVTTTAAKTHKPALGQWPMKTCIPYLELLPADVPLLVSSAQRVLLNDSHAMALKLHNHHMLHMISRSGIHRRLMSNVSWDCYI